jgi:hypothetical protein
MDVRELLRAAWLYSRRATYPRELNHDDGEVIATMKVRCSAIEKQYEQQIEALFVEGTAA